MPIAHETISVQDRNGRPENYRPLGDYIQIDSETLHWCEGIADAREDGRDWLDGCPHHCGGEGAIGTCIYAVSEPHECTGPTCPHYLGVCDCRWVAAYGIVFADGRRIDV